MGRKKLENPRKHTAFRFTNEELEVMREAAKTDGMSLSAWVRVACVARINRAKRKR